MSRSVHDFSSRAEYFESLEDASVNPSDAPTLGDLIHARLSRRGLLKGALGLTAVGALAASPLRLLAAEGGEATAGDPGAGDASGDRFNFDEIAHGVDETHHVAPVTAPMS